jgi:hypothetical protein
MALARTPRAEVPPMREAMADGLSQADAPEESGTHRASRAQSAAFATQPAVEEDLPEALCHDVAMSFERLSRIYGVVPWNLSWHVGISDA